MLCFYFTKFVRLRNPIEKDLKLHIKYMVSNRCKMVVKEELKKMGLHFIMVDLGEVEIMEDISEEERGQFKEALSQYGLELIGDKKSIIIEKIKTVIIEIVHHSDEFPKQNISDFLSERLDLDSTYLTNLFSSIQGITIQQFVIEHKIARVKELIMYGELSFKEIAWKMNYSSIAHLSNQFKKITGLTPSHFRQLKDIRRTPIEEIGMKVESEKSKPDLKNREENEKIKNVTYGR